ncbi:stage V sporulation protein AB [Bacillus sp. JJ722]|uniref:stage V sporulation protein AB n=1 Tax=Bacillus sp. JJ722 TaxID=3122973 RepID=UPI002FFD705B
MILQIISILFVGFAGGLAVGSGFVAFLTVLGVIPRITQLTKTESKIHYYELSVIAGVVVGGWASLNYITLHVPVIIMGFIGILNGVFNGMLAAALTEVLNVLPILAKRIGFHEKIIYLLMAIVLGKICGSLFQWIYFIDL